jgi:D-mannonate dehydratase
MPELTRCEVRARRSQTFHARRLATARTPAARAKAAHERILAVLDRSDEMTAARISAQVTEALTRIADVADEMAVRNRIHAA